MWYFIKQFRFFIIFIFLLTGPALKAQNPFCSIYDGKGSGYSTISEAPKQTGSATKALEAQLLRQTYQPTPYDQELSDLLFKIDQRYFSTKSRVFSIESPILIIITT